MAELAGPLKGDPPGPAPTSGRAPRARSATPEGDLAFCRSFLRRGSRAVYAASFGLPADVRDAAVVVLAFRRSLGEAASRPGTPGGVIGALEERVARAFDGAPEEHPIDRAFAEVAREHAVPRAIFDAIVEGLSWDRAGRRHATFEALLAYAVRTGATTTVCLGLLLGRRDRDAVARACDLGVAMKLTRIARDVGEHARAGRLHLPLEWLEEARVDVDRFSIHPAPTRGVRDVVLRLLRATEPLDARAEEGIGALPEGARAAARAARLTDAAIAEAIRKSAYDTVSRRPALGAGDVARIVARALRPLAGELAPGPARPPLAAAHALVEAVAGPP